jgi:hypothetical protein
MFMAPPLPIFVPILISVRYDEIQRLTRYSGVPPSLISLIPLECNPSSTAINVTLINKFYIYKKKHKIMSKKIWIKDSTEDRETILRAYFSAYYQDVISNEANKPFKELTLEEIKDSYEEIILNNAYSIEHQPNTVICKLLGFIFTHLNKFTPSKEEGVKLVLQKDMPANFNKYETSFLELSIDSIMEYYQDVMEITEMTSEEYTNYTLDLLTLFKKYGMASGFKFDDNLSYYSI